MVCESRDGPAAPAPTQPQTILLYKVLDESRGTSWWSSRTPHSQYRGAQV